MNPDSPNTVDNCPSFGRIIHFSPFLRMPDKYFFSHMSFYDRSSHLSINPPIYSSRNSLKNLRDGNIEHMKKFPIISYEFAWNKFDTGLFHDEK